MEERRPGGDVCWESFGRAWKELGLGDFLVTEPGTGLLEIRIAPPPAPAVAADTIRTLLTSLLERLAGEPVAVSPASKSRDAPGDSLCFLVGSPQLMKRIGTGYAAGRDAAELMEEAWT